MTFDGKSEKFELFEDLFHTMIKMQPVMTEQLKINHFHSLLRKRALQTLRNINTINRQTLEFIFISKTVIFRRKYVKPESQATAKHKWHSLIFDPNTMKLPDFLEELNQGAENAFGGNAKRMIDSLLYAKLPPKLKRSVNMVRLENGTYEEIVAHLERELELNALEELDDLPIATRASASTSSRSLLSTGIDTSKEAQCAYCKANGHFYNNCPKLKKKKELEDKTGKKSQRPTYPPCDTCGKKITRRNDVGKALERIYDPREIAMMTKITMTQKRMKNPRRQIIIMKYPPQANPLPKSPSQKTDFATTLNT